MATQRRTASLVGSCIALLACIHPADVLAADDVGRLLTARRPTISMQLGVSSEERNSIASQIDGLHDHMRDALIRYPKGGQDTEGEQIRKQLIEEIAAHEKRVVEKLIAVLGPARERRLANIAASEVSPVRGRIELERFAHCTPIDPGLLLSGTSEVQGKLLDIPDNLQKSLSELGAAKKVQFEEALRTLRPCKSPSAEAVQTPATVIPFVLVRSPPNLILAVRNQAQSAGFALRGANVLLKRGDVERQTGVWHSETHVIQGCIASACGRYWLSYATRFPRHSHGHDAGDGELRIWQAETSELLVEAKLYSPVRVAALAGEFILLETYAFNR